MNYYVYILRSLKDGKRYIGYTSDLKKRIESHNNGLTTATRNRKPFELLCYKYFTSEIEAIKFERYLKKMKGGNKFKEEVDKMTHINK